MGKSRPPFYPGWPPINVPLHESFPKVRENFDVLAPIVFASYQDGDPPEAALGALAFGDEEFRRQFRYCFYEGGTDGDDAAFILQKNDGDDSTELWRDIWSIRKEDCLLKIDTPRFKVTEDGVVIATAFYSDQGELSIKEIIQGILRNFYLTVTQTNDEITFDTDKLIFNSDDGFYLTKDSKGKPIVNIGGTIGTQ